MVHMLWKNTGCVSDELPLKQQTTKMEWEKKISACFQRGSGQTEINVAPHTVIRPQAGSYFLECLLFRNVLYL